MANCFYSASKDASPQGHAARSGVFLASQSQRNANNPFNGLIELLHEWRDAGVNHAALGMQMAQRPAREIIQELAEEVLPLFPALAGPKPHGQDW